jgi:small subunit ribosomal protein S20
MSFGVTLANIKSQKKRIRTNEAAHLRNKEVKSAIKTSIRNVRKAINDGDKETAQSAYAVAARRLDKAAGKGVIHRNQAANRKSGLATAINAM